MDLMKNTPRHVFDQNIYIYLIIHVYTLIYIYIVHVGRLKFRKRGQLRISKSEKQCVTNCIGVLLWFFDLCK